MICVALHSRDDYLSRRNIKVVRTCNRLTVADAIRVVADVVAAATIYFGTQHSLYKRFDNTRYCRMRIYHNLDIWIFPFCIAEGVVHVVAKSEKERILRKEISIKFHRNEWMALIHTAVTPSTAFHTTKRANTHQPDIFQFHNHLNVSDMNTHALRFTFIYLATMNSEWHENPTSLVHKKNLIGRITRRIFVGN